MPSLDHSTSVGKLIVLQISRNDYNPIVTYKWVNEPGLAISIRHSQSEPPVLHADISLLKFLTQFLQRDALSGW